MKPYPEYKETGIEWLGEIPRHWQITRLKNSIIGSINGIWGNEPDGENDIPCIRVADFNRSNFTIDTGNLTLRSIELKDRRNRILEHGDLLIEKSGGGDLQPVGAVVLFDHDFEAVTSNFMARMPVRKNFISRFLCYIYAHLYSTKVNTRSIKQTTGIQNIDQEAYLNENVCIPSKSEQYTIATYLDRETSRIDTLIAKKQRQIELLQEKRSALISHVVTKGLPAEARAKAGLDPDVKMKDSGVEWLGEVPEHWEVVRLKNVVKLINNKVDGIISDLRYIGLENIKSWEGKLIDNEHMRPEGQANTFERGDVLFSKLRPYLAKVFCANFKGMCTSELLVLRPHKISQYYLLHLLLSKEFIYLVDSSTYGAKMPRANWEYIGNIYIPNPPKSEQNIISNYLQENINKMDNLIDKINQSINSLKEYRTALISAAVTGKIDVRDEVEKVEQEEEVRIAAESGREYGRP